LITRLAIQNFKIFDYQEFTLPGLTLLTGLNGTGKSTVIQSLLLLRQSFQQRLLPDFGLALNGDLVQIGTGQDALFDGVRTSEEIGFDLEVEGQRLVSWRFAYDMAHDVLQVKKDRPINTSVYSNSSLFTEQFQYLRAERIGPRASFEMSEYSVRTQRQVGVQGEYAAHFLNEYQEHNVISTLEHPKAKGNNLRHQVEAWMTEISPGIRLDLDAFQKIDRIQLGVSFVSGNDVTNPYRPTNVGFGIIYVLPILVALLSAIPGSLIIIENPEAHLHPKGQSKLGELVAKAANVGIQIILETHSDHVLNGVRVATKNKHISAQQVAIHYFGREEGRRTYYNIPIDEDGNIERWPEGFFDEYENMLIKLL
jgi:predicted ATPase